MIGELLSTAFLAHVLTLRVTFFAAGVALALPVVLPPDQG